MISKSRRSDLLIAIHTLSRTGELPRLYEVPKKQLRIERLFYRQLQKCLKGIGLVLLKDLESRDRVISPHNLFGYIEADMLARATSMEEAYYAHMGLGMEIGYLRGAKEIKELAGVALNWDINNPHVKRILAERSFIASEKTISRMTGDVKKLLQKGYDDGLSSDKLAKKLKRKFYGMTHQELEFISRTEVGSAQNLGAFNSYEEAEIDKVQWLATKDDRTRLSHLQQHGKIRKRGNLFNNGLRYPGDKDGDISEWVACRCAIAPVVKV